MNWLNQSLNRKFVAGTAAGLLSSSLVFLVLFVNLYETELAQERADAAKQVNRLLQTSLENAMLKRDLDGLRTIVERLGDQPDIVSVMITNPAGEVRFASPPRQLGKMILPPSMPEAGSSAHFIQAQGNREVLRSINPVHNKQPCQECHGPVEKNPINGILYVDYDAAPLRHSARTTTLLLMLSGALIVLLNLAGGWWFIRRFILLPIGSLTTASARLAMGDFDTRVELDSEDELAQLGRTFNNMAAHLQAKLRELEEKEQFLQQLVDAIPDGVRIIDPEFRVLLTNRACREQLGCGPEAEPEVYCYRQAHDRSTPCPETLLTCPVQEIRKKEEPLRVVHQHTSANGSKINVEIYSSPMHVTLDGQPQRLVVESIRNLEQAVKFSHEQKLSELGRLAAGVAHEIHNPLTSVRLALHAMQNENESKRPDTEQVAEYLNLVDHEVDRCIEVTERLLRLSVPPPPVPELVYVDRVVDDTLSLLQWDAENLQVEIESDSVPSGLRVMATDSELRMVVLNLAQNALHAMPNGGTLRIESRREDGWVVIDVSDTGVGIKTDDLQHIFEPFFSRRADGVQGTGLGLSITRTIVEKHKGAIEPISSVGHGSTFSVRFPDADLELEE